MSRIMDGLALASSTSHSLSAVLCVRESRDFIRRRVCFRRRKRVVVFVSKDGGEEGENRMKLDQWDLMELKFGRHLGEDPNLTLAKIKARKMNPDASYLDVEKSFYKNKGKLVQIEEIPFVIPRKQKKAPSDSELNMIRRPLVSKGVKFETGDRKALAPEQISKVEASSISSNKRSVPNVILRRPGLYAEGDIDDKIQKPYSGVKIRQNLALETGIVQSRETFSDMTLLRKPGLVGTNDRGSETIVTSKDELPKSSGDSVTLDLRNGATTNLIKIENEKSSASLPLRKPAIIQSSVRVSGENLNKNDTNDKQQNKEEMLQAGQVKTENIKSESSAVIFSVETEMQAASERLDHSAEETSTLSATNSDVLVTADDSKDIQPTDAVLDSDWNRAKYLIETGEREEMEIVSASTKGFVVSFRSLIGFLPYHYLTPKWKFPPYEAWLKQNDIKPTLHSQGFTARLNVPSNQSLPSDTIDANKNEKLLFEKDSVNAKLDNIIMVYDQEKLKFMSSMVGKTIKVNVVVADQKLKKLLVSLRTRGNDELAEKKRSLMARLRIGDTVKCCINKITYIGIFVEIEGIQALIHRTEVSWDATLDPAAYFKIGQVLEAKVHQLDFTLERISLSLKEAMPNPLADALDYLVGDSDLLDGTSEAVMDAQWPEVDSLIEELQQIDGIQSVSKGRFLLSPGLAPTFQVYMAAMYADQYKLLARSENKVQELIVQSSLSKEEIASTIMSCASRVR